MCFILLLIKMTVCEVKWPAGLQLFLVVSLSAAGSCFQQNTFDEPTVHYLPKTTPQMDKVRLQKTKT